MSVRMSLGAYTFERNPSIYSAPDLMTPIRRVASVETYESIAVFSWGVSIIGKEISLKWEYLPDSQYNAMMALYIADTAVVFDPQQGDGKTYNVELMGMSGAYHYKLNSGDDEDVWRSKISLDLLVISEVVA